MPRIALDLNKEADRQKVKGQWRLGPGLVPGEPNEGLVAQILNTPARLAEYGFSFDLQVFAPQMADAAGLAEACPDVTFILQHAGMLEDLSPQGQSAWRGGMMRPGFCPARKLHEARRCVRALRRHGARRTSVRWSRSRNSTRAAMIRS